MGPWQPAWQEDVTGSLLPVRAAVSLASSPAALRSPFGSSTPLILPEEDLALGCLLPLDAKLCLHGGLLPRGPEHLATAFLSVDTAKLL